MNTTKEEIEAVLAGCDGVKPGPWYWSEGYFHSLNAANGDNLLTYNVNDDGIHGTEADERHIARLSPEFVRELAALALEALSSREAGWQGIETAPRDGTRVLVTCMKGDRDRVGEMHVDYWHTLGRWSFEGFGKFNDQFWPATHWRPLPIPPDQGSKSP